MVNLGGEEKIGILDNPMFRHEEKKYRTEASQNYDFITWQFQTTHGSLSHIGPLHGSIHIICPNPGSGLD